MEQTVQQLIKEAKNKNRVKKKAVKISNGAVDLSTNLPATAIMENNSATFISLINKHITIKAVPRSESYAAYITYNNVNYFHDVLVAKKNNHIDFLSLDDDTVYKTPFTNAGFKFHTSVTSYHDKGDAICMPELLMDKPCAFTLCITPYDFTVDDKRIVGLKVNVKKIQLL